MDEFDNMTAAEILDVIADLPFVERTEEDVLGRGFEKLSTIIFCRFGDYTGSDLDAANHREWKQMEKGLGVTFHETVGCFSWLYRDPSETWLSLVDERGMSPFADGPADHRDQLDALREVARTLVHLTDYPLISDETHSEYITELADSAWDGWLSSDVRSELARLAPTASGGDLVDEMDPDSFRGAYYEFEDNEWNAETATSVVNGRHDDAVRHVARTVFGWDV